MKIIQRMDFFIPEVKNQVISRLRNTCFAILNIAISVWLLLRINLRNKHGIHQQSTQNSSNNSTHICGNSKILSVHQS